jgi:hypothetical protein
LEPHNSQGEDSVILCDGEGTTVQVVTDAKMLGVLASPPVTAAVAKFQGYICKESGFAAFG